MMIKINDLNVKRRIYGKKLGVFIVLILSIFIKASFSEQKPTNSTIIDTFNTSASNLTQTNVSALETTTPSKTRTCMKAAIEQFPSPIIHQKGRKYGGIVIYIVICIYSFLGLAIICDNYFVKSLDRICEEMKLSADVAGATFMAAGSSAPELATVIIGVFLAEDDIGISGVIGSAVFNIMFVIAMCGLFATTALYLNWWPLCRDCFFYYVSIVIMLIAISNESINWFESVLLLVTYVIYCVALYYNESLEKWVSSFPPFNKISPIGGQQIPEDVHQPIDVRNTSTYEATSDNIQPQTSFDKEMQIDGVKQKTLYYKPKESEAEVNPLNVPVDASTLEYMYWRAVYPIHYLSQMTMPDCKNAKYQNWYSVTFTISMIWISFYSYIMVWMITIIGHTLTIPDTVMGLTFVAAGVSVPDALSSIAVVKEGYGDMAVSNAVGSNVFDILVCLGLPWFLKTGIINPGSHIIVYSKGLTYSTISLLSTVVILITATHYNGWKLDKKYGFKLLMGYFIFIILASLYELNVFGIMNPPICPSKY